MIVARTNNRRIYVDDFDTILACFKSMNANWASNNIRVEFGDGTVHSVRGYLGIVNQNTNQEKLYGAFSWNNQGQLEELVFELDRVQRNVDIFISSSVTSLNLGAEHTAIKKFLAASLAKVHEKFIAKTLNRPTGGGGVHPILKAMPRHYNVCNQAHYNNAMGRLFTQPFVAQANRLKIHFN